MWPVGERFLLELKKPVHTVVVKVDFLDSNFRVLKTIKGYNSTTTPTDALIDGAVDVDVSRGTRRTLTMSLLNLDGSFTADSSVWTNQDDWDGYFYINRLVRVWRGVRYDTGEEEYAPVGTFMVDKSEALVERGMSTVVLAGSDLWKKFAKSQFGTPRTFTANTAINTIVSTLASEAGVTQTDIDPLIDRTTASKQIPKDITFEADETRGEALMKIGTDYGIEIYFNPMGVLTTREFTNPLSRPITWKFDPNDDMAFFLRSVIDDDRLYNHVIVVGTANAQAGGTIYKAELRDSDPGSPTNTTRIGDRVFRFESSLLGTQEAVNKSAITIYYKHFLISQTVALEAVCNPALEGNDVLLVEEQKFASLNSRFLLGTFSVPLVTSKQKLSMKRVLDLTAA